MASSLSLPIQSSVDLSSLNTMALPAIATNFYTLNDCHDLAALIAHAKREQWDVFILGGGSNVLFQSSVDGLIIHMCNTGVEQLCETATQVTVKVQAGEEWDKFLKTAIVNGWYGLENLAIIPGTVGAAPVQNIGAYGQEVADCIHRVHCFDTQSNSSVILSAEACLFSYRDSLFKTQQRGRYIITAVEFVLDKVFVPNIDYQPLAKALRNRPVTAENVREAVIHIRQSKLPSPDVIANCGSFFKNPIISKETFQRLQSLHPELPSFVVGDAMKVAAGWLIEQSGWKGKNLGSCGMYEKQALVLINHGNACFSDVNALADQVKKDVYHQFSVQLEVEPVVIA